MEAGAGWRWGSEAAWLESAEAAEARRLRRQGGGSGSWGGLGGRCDRSRSGRAIVSVACVCSGGAPKRSVLMQVSYYSVGVS